MHLSVCECGQASFLMCDYLGLGLVFLGEHLVVAVQKDGKFPYAAFKCTMCDCYFNDVFAKKAHVKGRRHRLNYKVRWCIPDSWSNCSNLGGGGGG